MDSYESTQRTEKTKLRLRFDYTNLERLSPLAKKIEAIQNDCSIRRQAHYELLNSAGLGSELHTYSMTLIAVMEMQNVRFRTIYPWIYNDVEKCGNSSPNSPMKCYFPQAEPHCPATANETELQTFEINYRVYTRDASPNITALAGGHSNVRAATTEYLLTRVSDIVQTEGERQLNIVFGNRTMGVPKNLITVHIRWGDKQAEMELVPIEKYVKAVQEILDNRPAQKKQQHVQNKLVGMDRSTAIDGDSDVDDEVHIYLATEDPDAYEEFMKSKPKHWNVYLDQYYVEMLDYRLKYGESNIHYYAAKGIMAGRNGLVALGSLLVAMEANDFVLTTASNWSRLMNELRKNVVHVRCQNCTTMIDLLYDEM